MENKNGQYSDYVFPGHQKNIILSESIYKTTFEGFMKGSSTFEDAVNANNALYDNLDLKARLEKVRIEQRINLILALGGGFKTND